MILLTNALAHKQGKNCKFLNAAKFLRDYNDLALQNIVLLISEPYENSQIFCNQTPSSLVSSPDNIFTITMLSVHNSNSEIDLRSFLRQEIPSLVVFPKNFFTNSKMHQLLANQSEEKLANNAWIIPYEANNNTDVSTEIVRMLLENAGLNEIEKLRYNSQIYIIVENESKTNIFEWYRVCLNSSPVVKRIPIVRFSNDSPDYKYFIWERRKNLEGCKLPATFIPTSSAFHTLSSNAEDVDVTYSANLMYSSSVEIEEKEYFGTSAEVFRILMDEMNFTLRAVIPDKKSYGVYNSSTKAWNGIMGVLAENRAEFSINDLTVTSSRSEVADFIAPIYFQCKVF